MSELFERPPADRTLIGRMIRAARLEPSLWAEVESDVQATGQAAMVVLLSTLAGGVGALGAPSAILLGAALSLGGWLLFAGVIWFVGVRLVPEASTSASFGSLLRTVGFANAPGMLRLLGIVPELRMLVWFIAAVGSLVVTVGAVRHALSYTSTWSSSQ